MIWLILVIVVALIVGPVMYLRPTAKDKRLTALRLQARALGMNVKLSKVAKLDARAEERVSSGGIAKSASISCTAYQLPIRSSLLLDKELLLLRVPAQPTQYLEEVFPGWTVSPDLPVVQTSWSEIAQAGGVQFLGPATALLPSDVLGVALEGRSVVCYWRETGQADGPEIAAVLAFLESFRGWLVEHFGTAEQV